MVSYEPFEYSYLLTTGSPTAIRETFTAHKDFAENPDLHENHQSWLTGISQEDTVHMDFSKNISDDLLTVSNSPLQYNEAEGTLTLTANTSSSLSLTLKYYLSGATLHTDDYSTLQIEYMIPSETTAATENARLFPCTGGHFLTDTSTVVDSPTLISDGQYHTLTVDMTQSSDWDGIIDNIRIDFFQWANPGDTIHIKSITLR